MGATRPKFGESTQNFGLVAWILAKTVDSWNDLGSVEVILILTWPSQNQNEPDYESVLTKLASCISVNILGWKLHTLIHQPTLYFFVLVKGTTEPIRLPFFACRIDMPSSSSMKKCYCGFRASIDCSSTDSNPRHYFFLVAIIGRELIVGSLSG